MVTPGFPPQLGGVETMVGHLADELAHAGNPVTVYAQRPRGVTYPPTRDYEVYRFVDWVGHPEFPVAPGLLRQLWRDAPAMSVLHAHSFHAAPAMMAATVPQVPLVFTPHFHAVGHTRLAELVHLAYDPLAKLLFRRATRVTCVSHAEADLLLQRYPNVESRLSVVPLAVDTHALTTANPIDVDDPVVLVVGRLEPYKNVDLVVRAFAALHQKTRAAAGRNTRQGVRQGTRLHSRPDSRRDARLVVCGGGSQVDPLRRLVAELGMADRVDVLGPVSDANVRRWQATAHVTVSASTREAFGLVVLEGAVAGSRVIASDIPAHREVRQLLGPDAERITLVPIGENGSRAAVGDLSDALENALGRARPSRPVGRRFDWAGVAQEYARIYAEVR